VTRHYDDGRVMMVVVVMVMVVEDNHTMRVMVVMMADLDGELGDLFTRRGLLGEPSIIGLERFYRTRNRLQ
jgi:hypothetical protein